MAINWDLNAGTIVTIVLAGLGTLWKLHGAAADLESKTASRHAENTQKFINLEASHQDMRRDICELGITQKECQKKITETREMVIRLDEANKNRP